MAKVYVVVCLRGDHETNVQTFARKSDAYKEARAIRQENTFDHDNDSVEIYERVIK